MLCNLVGDGKKNDFGDYIDCLQNIDSCVGYVYCLLVEGFEFIKGGMGCLKQIKNCQDWLELELLEWSFIGFGDIVFCCF